ncbi:MAG TPA: adenylate/guanylate cyclase domain-containing protein [Dongiaceae bacterium]
MADRQSASRLRWYRKLNPQHWRLSIVTTLALSFGSLVVISVGIAIWLLLSAASSNTRALIATNGQLVMDLVSQNLRHQLDPTENQLNALGRYILSDHLDVFDSGRINDLLLGTLAADEQIDTLIFVRSDLRVMRAARDGAKRDDYSVQELPGESNSMFRSVLDMARERRSLFWGTPFYSARGKNAVIPLYMPVRRGGGLVGVLRATVAVSVLSSHINEDVGTSGMVPFAINADGFIIAHPDATSERAVAVARLLRPSDLGDQVLMAFRANKPTDIDVQQRFRDLGFTPDFKVQQVEIAGENQLILYKTLSTYAPTGTDGATPKPWIIGLHLPDEDIAKLIAKVTLAGILGGVVMLLAVGMSVLIGRRIARPMARLALASERVARLELDDTALLRGSRLREVDVALTAFNRMRIGLGWLATYVPRSLLPQLIRAEAMEDFASKERAVTVLFTDIIGFSATAQRLEAPDLATFLNRHFSLLGEAIDDLGGTIDKYIGDSVMAFWGAPARQPDHVQRACRAALQIAEQLHADNRRRARKGLQPVRLRIGIETGIAIAGNIGAPGRVNYTLVGDSVNLAQRFEQFGKSIDDGTIETIIVISAEVADALPPELTVAPLGNHLLPGRVSEMPLFRLVPPHG